MIRVPLSFLDHVAAPVFVFARSDGRDPVLLWLNATAAEACAGQRAALTGLAPTEIWGPRADMLQKRLVAALRDGKRRTAVFEVTPGVPRRVVLSAVARGRSAPDRVVMTSLDAVHPAGSLHHEPTFIGLAALGLQGPLRNIRVLLDLMAENPDLPVSAFSGTLGTIGRVCDRAFDKITETITYCLTRLAPAREEPVSLRTLVDRVAALQDQERTAKITCPAIELRTDTVALSAIVAALMVRAFHAGPAGVGFDLSVEAGPGEMLAFSVEETGPALAADEIAALDRGRWFEGVPFGISALRQLVTDRGGTLQVDRTQAGTRFRFTLPGRFGGRQA